MRILAIGNSFAQDATRYLHKIGACGGVDIKTVNLYVANCSLRQHYLGMLEEAKNCTFEYNGENTGINVTLKDGLMSDEWDYVVLHQLSIYSTDYKTYQPYLSELVKYVKMYCPHTKIIINQTWAYEEGSRKLAKMGYDTPATMLEDIKKSYKMAVEDVKADGLIPSGEVFQRVIENGVAKMHRDTFHAERGIGRYALALTWYAFFTHKDVEEIEFDDFDVPVEKSEIEIVKKTVKEFFA